MPIRILKSLLCLLVLTSLSFSLSSCTSSDESDPSVLEEELENIDVGDEDTEDMEDMEDIGDVADEDLVDEVDEEDQEFDDSDEEEVAELDDEELDIEDEELDELDDELDDDSEIASNDEDDEELDDELDDEDDDEFAEFDDEDSDGEEKSEVAQNEKSLEEELAQSEYPVAENAQATFPEEVVGTANPQPMPPMAVAAVPSETVVSETQNYEPLPGGSGLPQEDLGEADPIVPIDENEPTQAQTWVPVVKIKTDPFMRNKRMMNAVYIARPKDSIGSISDKIFSADRVSELRADNPHLAKGIDPGDKIYYNSPNRPEDSTQIKYFYDDIGLKPQYYVTKNGDNMRRLGSKLLGFPDGWKEVWAINPNVDSKTILPGGVEVKYWTGNEPNINLELAQNDVEEIAPEEEMIEDDMSSMGTVDELPADELPPEPPLPDAEIAMPENNLEPEEIPDFEAFPEEGVTETPTPAVTKAADPNESLIQAGVMGLLLLAGVALVAIQIKKRKDTTGLSPQSLEYTQV